MGRLLVCAYDVADERRLAAALAAVTAWSHGGQKSAFECLAAPREIPDLGCSVGEALCPHADRLALFRPDVRFSFGLGVGRIAEPSALVYVG